MTQIRKILVPVDFSECSQKALDTAVTLAASFDGAIDLVHVWDVPVFVAPELMVGSAGTSAQPLEKYAEEQARTDLEKFAEETRGRGVAINATRVLRGDTALRVCEVAENEHFDLIVMGTHGRSGLSHLLLGSVAEKVVRHSKVPVLTVRTRETRS
jgi:nucleotide-binding universal stress UspA family protein